MRVHVPSCSLPAWLVCGFVATMCLSPAVGAQSTSELAARLERLERQLENKALLDLVQQVELLQQEVRQLRGELETQAYALEQVRKSQRETWIDADRRIGLLEGGGVQPGRQDVVPVDPPLPTLPGTADAGVAGTPATQSMAVDIETPAAGTVPVPPRTEGHVGSEPFGEFPDAASGVAARDASAPGPHMSTAPSPSILPSGPTVDSAESEAAYRAAFAMLKAGQYDQSIAAFNAFLQTYPSSQYADNAQYWLGEAYYVMRQFEPAIEQYQKLVNGYPDSKKQSHAMLKIAYSYHELGLTEQAVNVLTELKNRFPGSAAARLADERLARIRSESL